MANIPRGKSTFIFLLCLSATIILMCSPACRADIEGLPPGTEEVINELLATMFPPEVRSVALSPDPQKTDTIIKVTAEIRNDGSKTTDKTTDAWVMYSTDEGASWERTDMDAERDGANWTAELPAYPAGTEVVYGFRARDTSGNIYTETPCLVRSWPPDGDPCMFEIAIDEEPVDDDPNLIPDDFDLMSFRAGEDEEFLYVELKVQGKITGGAVSPVFTHMYGIVVQNPDRGDPHDIITQGFLGVYAPLANVYGFRPCMVVSRPGKDVVMDSHNIECKTDGDARLWMKIHSSHIGANASRFIRLMAADGALTGLSPLTGIFYDYTHVSSLVLMDRAFSVQ